MRTARLETEDGKVVCARCALAASPWTRMRGLLGRSGLEADEGMLFRPPGSIHLFFMRFAIDAIFINEQQQVMRVGRRLRPWTIGPLAPGALCCIELPAGRADATQPGHVIELTTSPA